MAMKYFTEAWRGDMSDEARNVFTAYRQHLASITPELPPAVRELAFETNLHDGLIRRIVWDGDSLRLELRCGDLRVGYFDLDLSYEQVTLSAPEVKALSDLAQNKNASALYDEVDMEEPGAFAHRILFWRGLSADQEVTIRFRGLGLTKTPQPNREFRRLKSRFV